MAPVPFLCRQCARALRQGAYTPRNNPLARSARPYSQDTSHPAHNPPKLQDPAEDAASPAPSQGRTEPQPAPKPEPGPMARRLEEATEDALLTGGRAGRRAVEDAGFSEDLKNRLLERVSDAQFRADNASALATAGLSPAARDVRIPGDVASVAQPWTGDEPTADAVRRMLDDAHPKLRPGLRGAPKIPEPRVPVDMRIRRQPKVGAGEKAATARDMAAAYAGMGFKETDTRPSDEEREAFKRELRERFSPGARAMPNSLSGLAAMANERIEDAIARGQFKNIPRGKEIKRDTRADNPFIDTTEYIMNNMIKRQEIVPPWIEKQQELVKAAGILRSRLRNDWKRHAARMIASHGGSLQEQMNRAADFARAEEAHNPRRRHVDQMPVPSNSTDDVVMVKLRQQVSVDDAGGRAAETTSDEPQITSSRPFRDPAWEAAERSYMELAIANLNSLTRSYNLMAPELAKKSYFSLEREMNNCFADVAPQLANEIKERAARPSKSLTGSVGSGSSGILDRFGNEGKAARIYDSKTPHYGFKEMWKDLWSRPE